MPESGLFLLIVCCCGYASLQGMVTFLLALVFVRKAKMRDKANWMLKLGTLVGGIAMIGILLIALNFVDAIIIPVDLLILIMLAVTAFLSGFGIGAIVGYVIAEYRSRKAVII
jgi:hypothetical protein